MLFFQIFWGILIGVIVAYVVRKFMEYTDLQKSGFITVFIIAVVLLAFSISELLKWKWILNGVYSGFDFRESSIYCKERSNILL